MPTTLSERMPERVKASRECLLLCFFIARLELLMSVFIGPVVKTRLLTHGEAFSSMWRCVQLAFCEANGNFR